MMYHSLWLLLVSGIFLLWSAQQCGGFLATNKHPQQSCTSRFNLANGKNQAFASRILGTYVQYHRRRVQSSVLHATDNDEGNKAKESSTSSLADRPNSPKVIPFDFARDDQPMPKAQQGTNVDPKLIVQANLDKLNREMARTSYDEDLTMEEMRRRWDAVDNKSTGYDTPDPMDDIPDPKDVIDERADWMKVNESDSGITAYLKEVYIGSPFDSRRKQQARYVIRSITLMSIGIGVIFTAIWYLAPGKFISYKGDMQSNNPTTRSSSPLLYQDPTKSPSYIDPEQLLQSEFEQSSGKLYFDEGVNPFDKAAAPNPRYSTTPKKVESIDGRSMDL